MKTSPTRATRATARILLAALCGIATFSTLSTARKHHAERPPELAGGAPSIDALVDLFLAALASKDEARLQKLRVTESEYRDLIIPGTVDAGKPPRRSSEQVREFFWQHLDTKSRYYTETILAKWGGREWTRQSIRFTKPKRDYAWYDAYGELRVDVKDEEEGAADTVKAGWIAEVEGRYKFIGLQWDD